MEVDDDDDPNDSSETLESEPDDLLPLFLPRGFGDADLGAFERVPEDAEEPEDSRSDFSFCDLFESLLFDVCELETENADELEVDPPFNLSILGFGSGGSGGSGDKADSCELEPDDFNATRSIRASSSCALVETRRLASDFVS